MKVIAAFNQDKALVGAFSVIVKTDCATDGSFYSTILQHWHSVREVFETPGSRHVANLLVREGLAVAAAEGVNIPSEEADHILQKVTT